MGITKHRTRCILSLVMEAIVTVWSLDENIPMKKRLMNMILRKCILSLSRPIRIGRIKTIIPSITSNEINEASDSQYRFIFLKILSYAFYLISRFERNEDYLSLSYKQIACIASVIITKKSASIPNADF